MSRLSSLFDELREEGRRALIPYLTAGDPDVEATVELGVALAGAGADVIELGIPYSDPLADGPTIQAAGQRALRQGVTLRDVMNAAAEISRRTAVPLVYLVYYNCIFRYGAERFLDEAAAAGVSGLVIPDLPPEESSALDEAARPRGVDLVYLLAPTSTPERIRQVAERTRGFIYCVSVTGVTGARREVAADLSEFVGRIRKQTDLPLAIGFGISTPEQAASVAAIADGAIVGSALVDGVFKSGDRRAAIEWASAFCSDLWSAIDSVRGESAVATAGE